MIRKRLYKLYVSTYVVLGSLTLLASYIINSSEINESLTQIEGMWSITIFILFRISFTLGMTLYSFRKCFKQENLHHMDIHFLFGLFFLGLTFGKFLDLLYKLTYFTADKDALLLLLKFRYILIIVTVAPLILIGIDEFLLSKSLHNKKLAINEYKNRVGLILIALVIIFESLIVSLALNLTILRMILIFIHIPSLILIVYIFYNAHKKKNILQIKPLIVATAFFIDLILYAISIMINPLRRRQIGFSATFTIFAELVDLCIIIIIFWGYYAESNIKSN